MGRIHGAFITVPLYTLVILLLGAYMAAAVLAVHVVVVPLVFKYSKIFQRSLIFGNFVQWPLRIDHEDPSSSGIDGARNLRVEFQSKIDHCAIKLGVWHILPQTVHDRLSEAFERTDKEELHRMLDDELVNSKTPIVLYCHGNSNSRGAAHRIKMYKFLKKMEFHIIAFDYRGYGDSTNVYPSELGVVEDALMVYEWLLNALSRGRVPPPVYVWGHSLGTGITSHLLGNLDVLSRRLLGRPPLPLPQALVLEAPFNNLADEVKHHPAARVSLVNWLPYFDLTFVAPFRVAPQHTFRSDEYLSRVKTLPVLILHARDDTIVPFEVGVQLYDDVLKSRSSGGAPVVMHAFDESQSLGHKYICDADNLEEVFRNFTALIH
ncbi:hypothetical protein JYU34_022306 [Plutella xylostella]|uniref:AB hydrolase-1 domain-containing protein n=1 Tax=Plutella xylostella TaxID=51655 RepID=A0ABQ7PQP1_PLUXY|nr:lysophosphatidylserine lipase ABHD12 [Plutella xylostella]KAG7295301.1 hypothetical protein JYU34_022306 [Plutella xylostella]